MNITNNRITQLSLDAAEAAVARAGRDSNSWNPVFADVVDLDGKKQGHIVSDGYLHKTWSFYPNRTGRNHKERASFESVVPKWVGRYSLANIATYEERTQS